MPLLCRLLGFAFCLSFSNTRKDTKRLIDCPRIGKNFGHIRIKENNVRALHIFPSPNTVLASSNDTLCLARFAAAFLAFHSKRTAQSSMAIFSLRTVGVGYRHNGSGAQPRAARESHFNKPEPSAPLVGLQRLVIPSR